MIEKLKEAIMATDAEVILLDIDGTIKDLVKEHQTALRITVNGFNRGKNLRRKFVFFLDKIAMSFVKAGILSWTLCNYTWKKHKRVQDSL